MQEVTGGPENSPNSNNGSSEKEAVSSRGRLREITAVLRKNSITRGITPEKLRQILEDLGPTYIKLGQIMSSRSDILPQKYCDELMHLRSDVPAMAFSQVEQVMNESFGYSWNSVF